ncbi:MAG: hypothetical protein JXA28_10545 [Bacteroidetes bacterium]|nr:hypothetical protein [Bacteroidota bacterium]
MVFLFLSVLCSVGIAVTFTFADRRGHPTFALFVVNYIVATAVALLASGGTLGIVRDPAPFALGIVMGALFVWCFFLFMTTVNKLGMVIPVSLMRLSAVLPTAGSILVFAEVPLLRQVAGIVVAFAALPLASREPITARTLRPLLHGGLGWGLVLFFSYGATDFLFKVQKEAFPHVLPYELLTVIFLTATLITGTAAWLRRERITPAVLLAGLLLGVLNLFSTYFFILALGDLPGIVVYPANGIGIILLSTLVGVLLWKEKLTLRNGIYIALAAVALLLIA